VCINCLPSLRLTKKKLRESEGKSTVHPRTGHKDPEGE